MSDDETNWHRVLEKSAVRRNRGRLVRVGARKLAVFGADDRIFVTENRCPHAAASLALGEVKGLVVACPRHGWMFNLDTGHCLTMEGFELRTYPTRIRGGWVEVYVEPADLEEESSIW